MNFRANASPPTAIDINSAELPASGAGAIGVAVAVPATITTAKTKRLSDQFDLFIV